MSWLIPIVAYLIFLPLSPFLDLSVSKALYDPESPWANWLYHYGIIPGWLLLGTILFYRREGVYIALVLIVGSGLICHGLKEVWGRPRPVQTVEFGGEASYRAVWQPDIATTKTQRSFCCGHCSMGFLFFTIYFIGKKRGSPPLAIFGLSIALFLGIALSLARITQGGHFLSDTVTSALVMWLTANLLAKIIQKGPA